MFVYLIHYPGLKGIKIGVSINILQRLRALESSCPIQPICLAVLEVPNDKECYKTERSFHLRFSSRRIKGEWFDLSDSDIALLFTDFGFAPFFKGVPNIILPENCSTIPLTTREAARILKQKPQTVNHICRLGKIAFTTLIGSSGMMEYRILEKDLFEYMIKENLNPYRKKYTFP